MCMSQNLTVNSKRLSRKSKKKKKKYVKRTLRFVEKGRGLGKNLVWLGKIAVALQFYSVRVCERKARIVWQGCNPIVFVVT